VGSSEGNDLTAIPGLNVLAVLTLLSEIGTNMAKWRHEKAFASWLGLIKSRPQGQRRAGVKLADPQSQESGGNHPAAGGHAAGQNRYALGRVLCSPSMKPEALAALIRNTVTFQSAAGAKKQQRDGESLGQIRVLRHAHTVRGGPRNDSY
jgi:hypothetical protein